MPSTGAREGGKERRDGLLRFTERGIPSGGAGADVAAGLGNSIILFSPRQEFPNIHVILCAFVSLQCEVDRKKRISVSSFSVVLLLFYFW